LLANLVADRVARSGAMTTSSASRALPWALIGAACLGSFAATSSGTTRAPFLLEMAHDLDVSMPLVANLVSVTSIAWGITSAAAGYLSDLVGRRVLLIVALLALAFAMCGQANAGSFFRVAVWASAAGGCAGAFTSVVFSEVSSRVEDRQRGRALGWVMSGQSLTLVIGVPLAAWVGSMIGWRGWNVCVAVLALAASLSLLLTVRAGKPVISRNQPRPALRSVLSPQVMALLGTGIAERICYGLAAVYFATFLQAIYNLSLAATAIPLAVFALGNVLGTILGGQLADRLHDRLRTFAFTMALSGVAALGLFMWHPAPAISVALGFVYVMLNALGRPSYMAALASGPEQMRGTVLGLNGTSASLGWIGAAGLGAAMISTVGFEGFGPLGAVLGLAGTGGALLCRRLASSVHNL
jgi:DHA1 family inner membrane transport protein